MDALISVIVPVYDTKDYLDACVSSILNQTYKNLEILLVDDASPDGSGLVCDEYAKNDPRVKVIHKEWGGLSDTRNVGLAASHGDFVSFIDSDDVLSPVFFEELLHGFESSGVDIAECNHFRFTDEGELSSVQTDGKTKILSRHDWLTESNLRGFLAGITCNKLYRRSVWDGITFPVGRLHEDEATIYKTVYKSEKIYRTYRPLYFYRKRHGSLTVRSFSREQLDQRIFTLRERAEFFEYKEKEFYNFSLSKYTYFLVQRCKNIYKYSTKDKAKPIRNEIKANMKKLLFGKCVPIKHQAYYVAFLISTMFK